jgi:hypothetical protein
LCKRSAERRKKMCKFLMVVVMVALAALVFAPPAFAQDDNPTGDDLGGDDRGGERGFDDNPSRDDRGEVRAFDDNPTGDDLGGDDLRGDDRGGARRFDDNPTGDDVMSSATATAAPMANIRERAKDGAPSRLLLDFDATADPTHGEQEGAYYHGYYGGCILHPLLIFDGETNQLITAVLRPGNTHASRGALALLRRIVKRLKEEWPAVEIEIRADAGFAVPEIYDYCEKEGIDYTIGLISNPRLEALAQNLLERAKWESQAKADERR